MRPRTGVFLLVSLTLWGVALSTGDRVCHLLAAIMSLMMLTGMVSVVVTLFTLKVDLTSARKRVLRGQTVLVKVSVRKRSLIPVSLIEIDITSPQGLNDIGRITISAASMRGREYRYTITCAHRGVYQVGIRQIRVTDVFGLFSFERPIRRKGLRLTVLPQVYEISPVQIKPVDDGPQGRIRNTDDLASPSGVRAWQDGDSLKKVHWKLTARRRELLVRTFEETAKPDVLILMDCAKPDFLASQIPGMEDTLCEMALSCAQAQLRAGYQVRMPLHVSRPTELAAQSAGEIQQFQNTLAFLDFDSVFPFEQVIMLEMRRLQRTGALILLSSSLNAQLYDIVTRVRALGVTVRYIWVSETEHEDQSLLLQKMGVQGIICSRINPWDESPTAENPSSLKSRQR